METGIAVFGTGRMGYPLVQRLLSLGYRVTAYNRDPEKAAPLADEGAQIAVTAGEAAAKNDLLVMFVAHAAAVESILDQIGNQGLQGGKTLIVMSTIGSTESQHLRDRAKAQGAAYIEAPVMGGPEDVLQGHLTILVGTEQSEYNQWEPLLSKLARTIVRTGSVGSASVVKLALNQFMASLVTALATSVSLVQSVQFPVDGFMTILKQFPYYAPSFDSKLPKMISSDYSGAKFTVEMMGKDVRLMVEEARRRGIYAETLQAISDLYESGNAAGRGELDYSAIFEEVQPKGKGTDR